MNTEQKSTWIVRYVDEETKRKVRVYAAENDLTIAQALAALIKKALTK